MVIKADNSLWGRGVNIYGQLGIGTNEFQCEFLHILDDVGVVHADIMRTLAIKTDGSLWTWGSNFFGRLGEGTTQDRVFPIPIMDDTVAVSVGGNATLVIQSDGSLWGWGFLRNCEYEATRNTIFPEGWALLPTKLFDNVMLPSLSWPDQTDLPPVLVREQT